MKLDAFSFILPKHQNTNECFAMILTKAVCERGTKMGKALLDDASKMVIIMLALLVKDKEGANIFTIKRTETKEGEWFSGQSCDIP